MTKAFHSNLVPGAGFRRAVAAGWPTLAGIVCLCLVSGVALGQEVLQQREPMRVTSDTPEYCWQLSGEVQHAQRVRQGGPPEAQFLAEEGRRMCERGLLRGGIARLRRALMILQPEYGERYRR